MMAFLRAHGLDVGPLQRPVLAGGSSGLIGCLPAAPLFLGFGSFDVAAEAVLKAPRPLTAALLVLAFGGAGALYGTLMRRAANDRRGGWLFGAVFGFLAWLAAPVAVLPLLATDTMASGAAAIGFFVSFIVWGAALGASYPFVHRVLTRPLSGEAASSFAAEKVIRRIPRGWKR